MRANFCFGVMPPKAMLGRSPRRLGGELGMTALLHTWGQTLGRHPNLHCLVPGGALDHAGHWHPAKGPYLFPVRALSRCFRGCLVSALREAFEDGELPRVSDPQEARRTLDRLMQHAQQPHRFSKRSVGEMCLPMQAELLITQQEGVVQRAGGVGKFPVNARIICATNRDLQQMITESAFQEGLF